MAVDCADIKARLDAKQAVLDKLVSGMGVSAVQDTDGSRIEYSRPNIDVLREQIALLQVQYDRCRGHRHSASPIQFFF